MNISCSCSGSFISTERDINVSLDKSQSLNAGIHKTQCIVLSKLTRDILIFSAFYSSFVNLRKKLALDYCTNTNLNENNHNSPIEYSSFLRFFFFSLFIRFASFFVFILDFVHNRIHLFEFGIRLCNRYSTMNNFNKPACNKLFAR